MNTNNLFRIEKDSLGKVRIPKKAYWGVNTQRAIENFPISGLYPHKEYVFSTVIIKKAAVMANRAFDLLDEKLFQAITTACDEILNGKFSDQFIVDPYQAGAGTSHHMNINEVIANRANEILGTPLGSYTYIHPNNHVNMSQSTNDVIPCAVRITALTIIPDLLSVLNYLEKLLSRKTKDFRKIIKSGRTHLQDALPITLGQEFSAYHKSIILDINRISESKQYLLRVGIGGTAVGTGINTPPGYQDMIMKNLVNLTRLPLIKSDNLFESMQNTSDLLFFSSSLRNISQTLIRIGNDLRLLSSGPKTGLSEISLPDVQQGSSIMPGKVNPSIIEMMTMVCFQIIGFDQTILLSSMSGQLELNVMLPLVAHNLISQIKILTNAVNMFNNKCLKGIKANEDTCRYWLDRSSGIAAILNPYLGYDKTIELVKISLKTGKSLKDSAVEKGFIPKDTANRLFRLKHLTKPNLQK